MRIIVVVQGPFGEKVLGALIQRGEHVVGVVCPPDRKGKAPIIPQDESKATYEHPFDDAVASVNRQKSARDLHNLIRGCDTQPGAHTTPSKGRR